MVVVSSSVALGCAHGAAGSMPAAISSTFSISCVQAGVGAGEPRVVVPVFPGTRTEWLQLYVWACLALARLGAMSHTGSALWLWPLRPRMGRRPRAAAGSLSLRCPVLYTQPSPQPHPHLLIVRHLLIAGILLPAVPPLDRLARRRGGGELGHAKLVHQGKKAVLQVGALGMQAGDATATGAQALLQLRLKAAAAAALQAWVR